MDKWKVCDQTMNQSEKILEIKDLCVEFKTVEGTVKAINHLNYTLHKGEKLFIVGESLVFHHIVIVVRCSRANLKFRRGECHSFQDRTDEVVDATIVETFVLSEFNFVANESDDRNSVKVCKPCDGCFNIRVITSAALRYRIGRAGN